MERSIGAEVGTAALWAVRQQQERPGIDEASHVLNN